MAFSNIRFFYNNKWLDGSLTESCSCGWTWTGENTRTRWQTQTWRSCYGALSGWGTFVIDATNNKLYFDEGGGTLTATISVGTYDADTLATEINTQMDSAGSDYTVNYNDTTMKFEITKDSGNFILKVASTTNAIWTTIGWTTGIDTASANSHIADAIRIHTHEWLKVDLGSAEDVDGVGVFCHNITATGKVYLDCSTDDFTTVSFSVELLRSTVKSMFAYLPSSSLSYRYYRIRVIDVNNPDGYIELGLVYMGEYLEPRIGYTGKRGRTPRDPSNIKLSDGGQVSTIQKTRYQEWDYSFDLIEEKEDFDEMFVEVGSTKQVMVLEKETKTSLTSYTNYQNNIYICRLESWKWTQKIRGLWELKLGVEEER